MKTAYSLVFKAAAKAIPEAIKIFNDALRIAIKPKNKLSKLKNKHGVSMRKLLDINRCHGVNAKSRAAKKPVILLYATTPIP